MTLFINNNAWASDYDWTIEQEQIDVTPERTTKPDPKWFDVDRQGHYHAFSDDERDLLPTLRATVTGEENPIVTYRCRICNMEIKPVWVTTRTIGRVHAPGRMSWRVELRAGRPHAHLLQGMNGTSVSVRIEEDGVVTFGIGLLRTIGAGVGDDGEIKWSGCVYGHGPMGSRKASS